MTETSEMNKTRMTRNEFLKRLGAFLGGMLFLRWPGGADDERSASGRRHSGAAPREARYYSSGRHLAG